MSKVILITGCSTGLGRDLANVALERGYAVVATARQVENLSELPEENCLKLSLDVTDDAQIEDTIKSALEKFGRLDVLVNNAGFGMSGAIEEVTDEQAHLVFETNVFGLLKVQRVVLPHFRQQRSGHIINLSSIGGIAAVPGGGIYCATKFAVEGLSEALAQEVAPLGIKVTIVEPGPFRTDFLGRSMHKAPHEIQDYVQTHELRRRMAAGSGKQAGDPVRAAHAMLDTVEMEHPPLRLPLGSITVDRWRKKVEQLGQAADQWEQVARGADFPAGE